jgi:hypothetical protein
MATHVRGVCLLISGCEEVMAMRLNQRAGGPFRSGRLVAGAAFVGALMCVSAGSASAAPIPFNTCVGGIPDSSDGTADAIFPGSAYRCESHVGNFSTTDTSWEYEFDGFDIFNTLSFAGVLHNMDIVMTAFFVNLGNTPFLSRLPFGYTPEPFSTSDGMKYIYFRVEELTEGGGTPQDGVDYTGPWVQDIAWFGDGMYVLPEVLHDSRPLDSFGATPITVPGSFCELCGPPSDPTIGGSARDFSDTTVVSTTVPEPASLLLLASGLGGAAARRRRQRALAARDSA